MEFTKDRKKLDFSYVYANYYQIVRAYTPIYKYGLTRATSKSAITYMIMSFLSNAFEAEGLNMSKKPQSIYNLSTALIDTVLNKVQLNVEPEASAIIMDYAISDDFTPDNTKLLLKLSKRMPDSEKFLTDIMSASDIMPEELTTVVGLLDTEIMHKGADAVYNLMKLGTYLEHMLPELYKSLDLPAFTKATVLTILSIDTLITDISEKNKFSAFINYANISDELFRIMGVHKSQDEITLDEKAILNAQAKMEDNRDINRDIDDFSNRFGKTLIELTGGDNSFFNSN